ncbi:MAG: DUF1269 domain-containing protein [Christensenellales bacterium]
MEKIISAIFKVESEGYQAMTMLRKAPINRLFTVSQAALVKKEDGIVKLLDSFDTGLDTRDDTYIGGLIGGLVGILGGPLGMLLGGSIGALTGSIVDTKDAAHNVSMLERVSQQLVDGEVVLIALEQEAVEGAAQRMLSEFDVSIVEDDAAAVAYEVQQAAELQKELEKEAKAKVREAKKEERKQKIEEHRAKIAADFEAFKAKFKKD